MIKKLTAAFLIVIIALLCVSCGSSAPEPTADFESVKDAVTAQRNGTDLKGKTIKVTATNDCLGGLIYTDTDLALKANLYVTIIADESRQKELENIKKGSKVKVTVGLYDDHLKYSIYIYADDYEIYG